MNKIGMTWDVKPEHWEEYKEIHLNAADEWPELLEMFASKVFIIFSVLRLSIEYLLTWKLNRMMYTKYFKNVLILKLKRNGTKR